MTATSPWNSSGGATRIFVDGAFDLLHAGHIRLLRYAHSLGPVRVGLCTDAFVASYKRTPILPYELRAEALLGCRYVADLVPVDGEHRYEDVWVFGENGCAKMVAGAPNEQYRRLDPARVVYIGRDDRISTTDIIRQAVLTGGID